MKRTSTQIIFAGLLSVATFSFAGAQDVQLSCARRIGGTYNDYGNHITVDASDYVYTEQDIG